MAEIKWIKLTTDMFDHSKIKYLRRLPEGNSIVLIWVMLLTMAGRCNAGGMIFLTENIPYTPKMLADELGFEENTVLLAIQALSQLEMVVTEGDKLTIANWEKHQNVEAMERAKEMNRKRVAEHRARKKLLEGGNVTVTLPVTECNGIEEDIEEDKDIDKEYISIAEQIRQIVSYLNAQTGKSYRSSTPKTCALIRARLKEGFTVPDFQRVIDTKCAQWLNDQKMRNYLRPETLFGTKFEGYLNENTKAVSQNAYSKYDV